MFESWEACSWRPRWWRATVSHPWEGPAEPQNSTRLIRLDRLGRVLNERRLDSVIQYIAFHGVTFKVVAEAESVETARLSNAGVSPTFFTESERPGRHEGSARRLVHVTRHGAGCSEFKRDNVCLVPAADFFPFELLSLWGRVCGRPSQWLPSQSPWKMS